MRMVLSRRRRDFANAGHLLGVLWSAFRRSLLRHTVLPSNKVQATGRSLHCLGYDLLGAKAPIQEAELQ